MEQCGTPISLLSNSRAYKSLLGKLSARTGKHPTPLSSIMQMEIFVNTEKITKTKGVLQHHEQHIHHFTFHIHPSPLTLTLDTSVTIFCLCHSLRQIVIVCLFFVNVVPHWNSLPFPIIDSPSPTTFKCLCEHVHISGLYLISYIILTALRTKPYSFFVLYSLPSL